MSLLADTLYDARRPLAGAASSEAFGPGVETDGAAGAEMIPPVHREEPGAREGADQEPARGRSTSFRREGQLLSREASFQYGGGVSRLPSGDPLSAGMGAARPKFPATNVGMTDVTVRGDSRSSELATGPQEGTSPGKVAAAAVSSGSRTLQSEVLSAPVDSELSRLRSGLTIAQGSTTTVSGHGETFLSRPPGRGAPSENPSGQEIPAAAPARPAFAGGPQGPSDVRIATDVPPATRLQRQERLGDPATKALALDQPATAAATVERPPAAALRPVQEISGPGNHAIHDGQGIGRGAGSAPAPRQTPPALERGVEARPPTLSIGRIDVTVIAEAGEPDAAPAGMAQLADSSSAGFLARNYLKRL